MVIDRDAEAAIIGVLEQAHAGGMRFDLMSEEVGERSFGGGGVEDQGSEGAHAGAAEVVSHVGAHYRSSRHTSDVAMHG